MRHLIAGLGVLGAVCAALFFYPIVPPSGANHGHGIFLVNLVWGLYYGIGFEPALIWYKIHGPFPTGFLDLFAMLIYPLTARAFLYAVIFKLGARPSWRKWIVIGVVLSLFIIAPLPILPEEQSLLHPIWIFGAFSEPP
jgi:hypothetical protein